MKIRSILFSMALGAFAFGCGGNDGEKFGSIADEVCACETLECAKGLEDKWEKLEKEMRDKYKDKEPDQSVKDAYKKAEDKAEGCFEKLEAAAEGGTEG